MTEPIILEENFDEECTDGTIELKILVNKKQKAEILKNQQKAEKWDELPDEFCRVDLDDMLEYAEDRQIKLRLKKRIEELKKLLENPNLTKEESMELQYWLRENTMALGEDK